MVFQPGLHIIVFEWEGFASNPFPKDPTLSPLLVCVCVRVRVCARALTTNAHAPLPVVSRHFLES